MPALANSSLLHAVPALASSSLLHAHGDGHWRLYRRIAIGFYCLFFSQLVSYSKSKERHLQEQGLGNALVMTSLKKSKDITSRFRLLPPTPPDFLINFALVASYPSKASENGAKHPNSVNYLFPRKCAENGFVNLSLVDWGSVAGGQDNCVKQARPE